MQVRRHACTLRNQDFWPLFPFVAGESRIGPVHQLDFISWSRLNATIMPSLDIGRGDDSRLRCDSLEPLPSTAGRLRMHIH